LNPTFLAILAALFGALVASVLGACVWRKYARSKLRALVALGIVALVSSRRSIRRRLGSCRSQAAEPIIAVLIATAAVFGADARAVTIAWTPIGDPGNTADTRDGDLGGTPNIVERLGAVPYVYQISTYHVTASQYVEFLNAKDPSGLDPLGLYNPSASLNGGITFNAANAEGSKYTVIAGRGNRPANYTTWYNAARFANWMNNAQGSGDTESGAYVLEGGTPTPSNANFIVRQPGATVFLPTEDEWYKAAYFDPGTKSYYLYPTSSETQPTASLPTALPNHANFSVGGPGELTDVGAYSGTTSPYGLFDAGGNALQWNELLLSDSVRGLRGGAYSYAQGNMMSVIRYFNFAAAENANIGFRLASVPEPSSGVLAILACAIMWGLRKRF
jgi:formylglycine-generating enzyme required for sulfatase activity